MEHLSKGEQRYAKRLIKRLIDDGYFITVYDGEEIVVRISNDKKAIISAMGSTEEDVITFYEFVDSKKQTGSFVLIYGNDENGEEVVADYTDNEICNKIWNDIFHD